MKRIKNGFTLVELLGVLIILGIILTITLYSVSNILDNSEDSLSSVQKSKVEDAAKVFYLKEGLDLEETSANYVSYGKKVCVTVSYLATNNYLDKSDIKDPKTNNNLGGYVLITNSNDKYTYEYKTGTPTSGSCVQP